MKNDQKNPIYPSVLVSCMLEQLIDNGFIHIWSLSLNLGFKPTSFNLVLVALAQITSYCHVTFMHHIVALHWLCSFSVVDVCPLSVDVVSTMSSMTPMKNYYYLQKCQASKTPLLIPIQSHSLAPALFYCIRTTTTYLLLAAVAEPPYPLHDLSLPQ